MHIFTHRASAPCALRAAGSLEDPRKMASYIEEAERLRTTLPLDDLMAEARRSEGESRRPPPTDRGTQTAYKHNSSLLQNTPNTTQPL